MLDVQIALCEGTQGLHKVIEANDKKPRPKDRVISLKLSALQKEIIVEATKAIDMLKPEGSTSAYLEVFQEMRADMKRVQSHLENSDVGLATQALEMDIIDTLKEMFAALNKG